ncbi:hypothetical protein COO91_09713 (plasmid) [Nostoc flagelliforme CCNUN1]|uniref:Uncharacterized protein n=1 Tax=Nostoc flagelliforme CCNUN1 TaxID=2038116 RepID=A0A2K8T785_9NOSO|nr:hypothetical protein COO91_09713 [Nostoc flagelliforme CCNUN1]
MLSLKMVPLIIAISEFFLNLNDFNLIPYYGEPSPFSCTIYL